MTAYKNSIIFVSVTRKTQRGLLTTLKVLLHYLSIILFILVNISKKPLIFTRLKSYFENNFGNVSVLDDSNKLVWTSRFWARKSLSIHQSSLLWKQKHKTVLIDTFNKEKQLMCNKNQASILWHRRGALRGNKRIY